MAPPHRRPEQLQAPEVATALPVLVSSRLPAALKLAVLKPAALQRDGVAMRSGGV